MLNEHCLLRRVVRRIFDFMVAVTHDELRIQHPHGRRANPAVDGVEVDVLQIDIDCRLADVNIEFVADCGDAWGFGARDNGEDPTRIAAASCAASDVEKRESIRRTKGQDDVGDQRDVEPEAVVLVKKKVTPAVTPQRG